MGSAWVSFHPRHFTIGSSRVSCWPSGFANGSSTVSCWQASRPIDEVAFLLERATFTSFRASRIEVGAAFREMKAAPARDHEGLRRAGAAFAGEDDAFQDDVVPSHLLNRDRPNSV